MDLRWIGFGVRFCHVIVPIIDLFFFHLVFENTLSQVRLLHSFDPSSCFSLSDVRGIRNLSLLNNRNGILLSFLS